MAKAYFTAFWGVQRVPIAASEGTLLLAVSMATWLLAPRPEPCRSFCKETCAFLVTCAYLEGFLLFPVFKLLEFEPSE